MDTNGNVGNFANVSVVRAVTIWDYLLFLGSFLVVGIFGFFGIKLAYNKFFKKNDVKNIGISSYEN